MHTTKKLKNFEELVNECSSYNVDASGLHEEDFICLRKIEYECKKYEYNLTKELDISNIKENTFTYSSTDIPQSLKSAGEDVKIGIIMKNSNDESKIFLINEQLLLTQKKSMEEIFSFDYDTGEKTISESYIDTPNKNTYSYTGIELRTFLTISAIVSIIILIIMIKFGIGKKKK